MKATVHEVGHLHDAGFHDETDPSGEVYSGTGADSTPETVRLPVLRTIKMWGVMTEN
jgi:hypothetical protein